MLASMFTPVLAALGGVAFGMFWYSPNVFGKKWAELKGFDQKSLKKQQKNMGPSYLVNFFATIIQAIFLEFFITSLGASSFAAYWSIAIALWLGFVIPTQLGSLIFNTRPFSLTLFLIEGAYQLLSVLILATLIGVSIFLQQAGAFM
ncbi:DUF1761 domain-containing protein [Candidatus Woesebacteria bacterium]|nr:DUF1761 domain-containing protein [Candidatus Woesebacteria bacterium]